MDEAQLRQNLNRVKEAVAQAARGAGRDPSEVRIVAVTKGQPPEVLRMARAVGLEDLGENRVEELEAKIRILGQPFATWHMVGHVQSRKAKEVAGLANWVHSVDSLKLARRLSAFRLEGGRSPLPVLVQVNTSGEETKSGFSPDEVLGALAEILLLPGLRVEGLMTMAPFVDDEATLRRCFRRLRALHEEARRLAGYQGRELSMGMSNDFRVAVEEGSTMIRIGTALFGERPA